MLHSALIMRKALFLCALALLALRFYEPGLAPFLFDEPFFQALIDWHMENRAIPTASIPGNAGIPYGPTALWFYGILRLATDRIEVLALCHAALSTGGVLVLWALLRRHFGHGAALWGLMLMAASPLLYFYSRLLWDNSITIPLTAVLLSLTLSLVRRRHWALCLGWGFTAALLFNLHLMNCAAIGACALFLLVAGRSERGTVKFLALSAMVFFTVSAPYLQRIVAALPQLKSVAGAGGLGAVFHVNRLAAPLSVQIMDYFYPTMTAEVLPFGFDPGLWLVAAGFAVLALRRSFPPALQLSTLVLAATLLLHKVMKVDITHPHYFNPAWAFSVVAVGAAWHAAAAVRWQRGLLAALAVATLASQNYVTISALRVVGRDLGTRDMRYGTAAREQRRFVEAACAANDSRAGKPLNLDLSATPSVFPYALEYHFNHANACKGQQISFERGRGLRVQYAGATATSAGLMGVPTPSSR